MIFLYFLILVIGLSLTTTLIILGSIASRKFNFSFSYLSFFSLIIYLGLGLAGAQLITTIAGVTLAGLNGLFEAMVGLKLIMKFDAKIEDITHEVGDIVDEKFNPHPGLAIVMVLVYMFIGWLGTLFV
jgi:hypothetical protein